MGLNVTHDAFSGSYGAFNHFRQVVAWAANGSYPFHMIPPRPESGLEGKDLDDETFYIGEGYDRDTHPGLFAFLEHKDYEGEISPEMCAKVAHDLKDLLPRIAEYQGNPWGYLCAEYVTVTQRFIDGCLKAANNKEPLEFL